MPTIETIRDEVIYLLAAKRAPRERRSLGTNLPFAKFSATGRFWRNPVFSRRFGQDLGISPMRRFSGRRNTAHGKR